MTAGIFDALEQALGIEPNDIVISPPMTLSGAAAKQFIPYAQYGRYFDYIDIFMYDIGTADYVIIGKGNNFSLKWYGNTDYYSFPLKAAPYDVYDIMVKESNSGGTPAQIGFIGCKHAGAIIERRS